MMNTKLKELQECMDNVINGLENATKQKDKVSFLNLYNDLKKDYDEEMKRYLTWLTRE